MNLKNCPECGKVFVKVVRNLCPDCIAREEEDFEKVTTYVKDHRGCTVEEVCEATEVDSEKVIKMIREGHLLMGDLSGASIPCESCGRPISSGKLCAECTANLRQGIQKIVADANPKPVTSDANKNRMYTTLRPGTDED